MLYAHAVSTTLDGVGFDQFYTTDIGRRESDDQTSIALLERTRPRHSHGCLVRREYIARSAPNESGLGDINTFFALVQQHNISGFIRHIDMFEKLGSYQRPAFSIKGKFEHVGRYHQKFVGCSW